MEGLKVLLAGDLLDSNGNTKEQEIAPHSKFINTL